MEKPYLVVSDLDPVWISQVRDPSFQVVPDPDPTL